jgi:hypothetical protein
MEEKVVKTIEIPLSLNTLKALATVLAVLFLLWAGYSFGPLYPNNRLKPHRWASDVCRQRGVDPARCEMVIWKADDKISTEVPIWDFCLEHGEMKRVR